MIGAGDLGPDEACYWQQGAAIRERGPIAGIRALAERFLTEPLALNFPSPLRWLWVYCMAVGSPWRRYLLSLVSALAIPAVAFWALGPVSIDGWAIVLAASSPLVWQLARRGLQDLTVGVVALLALGCALHGNHVGLAIAIFALVSLKEAAVLYVPAILGAGYLGGGDALTLGAACAAGVAGAAIAIRAVVGPLTWQVFCRAREAPENLYTKYHQAGAPHRLVVDLALVSPAVVVGLAAASPPATIIAFLALAILAHAFAPVRNVRTIVAVDIVARAWLAHHAGIYVLQLLAVDAFIFYRIRHLYDPVTSELTKALGMSPPNAVPTS